MVINVEFFDFGKCVVVKKVIKEGEELFIEKFLIMGYVMDKDNNFVLLCDNCVVFIFIVEDYFGSILEIMEFDLKELIKESWLDILIVICDKC